MLIYSLSMCAYIPLYPTYHWYSFRLLLVLSSGSNAAMKILSICFGILVYMLWLDIYQVLKLLVIGYRYDQFW